MREGEFNGKKLEYIRGIYALIGPDVRRYCVGGTRKLVDSVSLALPREK